MMMTEPTLSPTITPKKGSDFRFNKWGDKHADVFMHEGLNYSLQNERFIVYENKVISRLKFNITYGFKEGRLHFGSIALKTNFEDDLNIYITLFNRIKEQLIDGHGLPNAIEQEWEDETYIDDESMWGFAVSIGDVILSAQWAKENTTIILDLNADEEPCNLAITYMNIYK